MKLDSSEQFFVLFNPKKQGFYLTAPLGAVTVVDTTDDILKAGRFKDRAAVETFKTQVAQAHIEYDRIVPVLEIVRIDISAKRTADTD